MNSDEIKSLIVKVSLVALSGVATGLHMSGDQLTAIVTDLADVIVLGIGIWMHRGMVKTPETK